MAIVIGVVLAVVGIAMIVWAASQVSQSRQPISRNHQQLAHVVDRWLADDMISCTIPRPRESTQPGWSPTSTGPTNSTSRQSFSPPIRKEHMKDLNMKRVVVAGAAITAGVVGLIWLILFAMGWGSVPVDEIGLHYGDGPIEGEHFEKIIEPGSGAQFLGISDKLVKLPVTQRDYTACPGDGVCDGGPIVASTRGGAEMTFNIGVTFTLNTKDSVIREFNEQICTKFDCTEDEGWDDMLRVNFRGPIEQALQQSVRQFTVDELYAGVPAAGSEVEGEEAVAILEQVQQVIATDLKENINKFVGGDYFCGPSFDRNNPDVCPDFQFQITDATPVDEGVKNAFADNVASQQQVITAQNNANADVAEAEGQRRAQEALEGLYSDPNYIAYLEALALQTCAANQNCTLIVGGDSTGVNVTPRQPPG